MRDPRRPADDFEPGSWKEVWDLTILVMGILAGPMLAVVAGIGLLILSLWALLNEPVVVVIPVGVMVGGLWYITERDKKAREAFEAELSETRREV